MLESHIQQLRFESTPKEGADVVIVVTSHRCLEDYWQERLTRGIGYCLKEGTQVLAVSEDWPGGAGNGLGTLYAYQAACEKARRLWKLDLQALQAGGASVAMYHTAGQGTRLAPLPGAESNNKSAVKLPSIRTEADSKESYLTVLEAVIRQTGLYAPKRSGRLSVFWGDQIFIPSLQAKASTHHADVLATLSPLPSHEEWQRRGLSRYGLAAVDADCGHGKLLEKIDYGTVLELQSCGELPKQCRLGTSLGSFSVSFELLEALLDEFTPELTARKGKLDSDPHFWMPLTLSEGIYVGIMQSKDMSEAEARSHYRRMQAMKERFSETHNTDRIFSAIDVGERSYWWDFGTIANYFTNCIKLAGESLESSAIRTLFGCSDPHNRLGTTNTDSSSYLQGCHIEGGSIRNSVLIGVQARHLDVENCVIINSSFTKLSAHQCLLYNVVEGREWAPSSGTVRADCLIPGSAIPSIMETTLARDGKTDWEDTVNSNPFTYAQLYTKNAEALSTAALHDVEAQREAIKRKIAHGERT